MNDHLAAQIQKSSLCTNWSKRSCIEAVEEIDRELQVRLRCFPRWMDDGRLSNSDAKDRLQRIIKASVLLQKAIDMDTSSVPPSEPCNAVGDEAPRHSTADEKPTVDDVPF